MIVALLATVMLLGLTGWMQTLDRFWGEEWLEELHELLADGLLVLIAAHVAGVLLASWRHRREFDFRNDFRPKARGRQPAISRCEINPDCRIDRDPP